MISGSSVYTQNYQRSFCCWLNAFGSRASMSITHYSYLYMCVSVCVRVCVVYVFFFQIIYVYIF